MKHTIIYYHNTTIPEIDLGLVAQIAKEHHVRIEVNQPKNGQIQQQMPYLQVYAGITEVKIEDGSWKPEDTDKELGKIRNSLREKLNI